MRRFYGYNGNNYCCDMRGMLGFLILFLLSKKPMHGQEIADEIARREKNLAPVLIVLGIQNKYHSYNFISYCISG
jgi:hypothetical protein